MHRRLFRVAGALTFALAASACSGTDSGSAGPDARDEPQRTTTTAPATTTTKVADLAAAQVTLTPVVPATAATAIAARDGDPTIYVAEQGGRVLAVVDGAVAATPVLDLAGRVTAGGEQGLLGLAFSPDGNHLYVHYSAAGGGDTTVDEYEFTPTLGAGTTNAAGGGTADPATRRTLLTLDQPQPNHNGGQLAFGPDGELHLGLGDGGAANDQGAGHAPEGNGQSPDTFLGKIVRLDVANGNAEIILSGLRNPWRFSFDRETDDLWVGDVGQNAWEEITRLPFAEIEGANLGWPLLEGSHPFRADAAAETVLPVFEVSHDTGACAIVGGFVYRGTRIPDLVGSYLFTDNCDGRVRALRVDDAGNVLLERDLGIAVEGPTSFGEADDGELYLASGTDGIFRIDPA